MTSASAPMTSSTSVYTTGAFWERLWRTAGIQFVGFFIITSIIYGYQPQVGGTAETHTTVKNTHHNPNQKST